MKLRNKKTGEIVEYEKIGFRKGLASGWKDFIPNAESIAELNENWEDYTTKEPLIKDKEARKIIKDFAERCGIRTFVYCQENLTLRGANTDCYIGFGTEMISFELIDGKGYYVEDLCGEEEE